MFSSCAMISSVFGHSWAQYFTAKSKGRPREFKPLGSCHRVILEVPIQEVSRSLATDKMTSNNVISTVALIGLMSTSYFQNLSWQSSSWIKSTIYWKILFNPCHMKINNRSNVSVFIWQWCFGAVTGHHGLSSPSKDFLWGCPGGVFRIIVILFNPCHMKRNNEEILEKIYQCSMAIRQTLHNKLEIANLTMSGLEGISG